MELKISDRFDNRIIKYFNEVSVNLVHNSIASTFSFRFNYDYKNPDHKEISCVSHFHDVEISHEGERLITGILLTQSFRHTAEGVEAQFSGYSTSGAMEDCSIPPNIYPIQSNGLSLGQIAKKIGDAFKPKIGVIIDPSVADVVSGSFKSSSTSPTTNVKSYLTQMATQKDIVLSHDEFGNLLFTSANTNGKPILDLDLTDENKSLPALELEMVFNGQQVHSHITVMRQASSGKGNAGEVTIRNPYVIGSVYRPKVITQSSGDDNDTKKAARRALGNELRALKFVIKIDRWKIDGKIIRPNNTILIFDPEIYVWHQAKFFIESVSFTGNEKQQSATLTCTLPEAYNDDEVVNIFRDINIHKRV